MNRLQSRRLPRLVLAALAAVALLAVASATSQGRALAQEVLQFFRRADSYERPLPAGQVPGTPDPFAPTAMPPAPLVSIEEAEVLAGFEPPESEVIGLAYFGGFTQSEIATMIDTPIGTVKGRMRLGLEKMRHQLAGLQELPS